jgi:hypothetical protein
MKNIEVEGVDGNDYPDFCDAYATYAEHEDGTPYDEQELEDIDPEVIYQAALESFLD